MQRRAHFRRFFAILTFFILGAVCSVPGAPAAPAAEAPGGAAGSPDSANPGAGGNRVVVIPVENEVDYGLFAFLKRATAEALAEKPDHIIYKVNTYGGELHSAYEIVDLIQSVQGATTWVYVEQKAISAGALISLACNRMAMGEGTTIGDCAPITQSAEGGIVMLGEKIQSPLRAKFRNLAERNGYPSLLSEAMVTADIGVVQALPGDPARGPDYFTVREWDALPPARKGGYREHKVIVREGQLLTMTDLEAQRYGFSQGSYRDFGAFLGQQGFTVIRTLEPNWSERMVRVLGKFAPILMLIGFGALYMEFKTPGLSVFGALGVVCLGIAFGAKYAVGLADHTELLLLLAGFALFMVEIYLVPGTFIAGVLGLALMVVALTLSLQGFTVPDPDMPWELGGLIDNLALTMGMAALALFVPLLAVRYVLPRLPRRASVVLATTMADARVDDATTEADLRAGARGFTPTGLRPAGKVVIDGVTREATTRGEFIDPGSPVEVIRPGRMLVVRAAPEAASAPGTDQSREPNGPADADRTKEDPT
ncbi:MAG TPA: serine protease [Fibrobacteria bacterium]|jgi:membrane-bound serine protease (ClpP class)|nr:serine protease [Fibrobacteria bacterium]